MRGIHAGPRFDRVHDRRDLEARTADDQHLFGWMLAQEGHQPIQARILHAERVGAYLRDRLEQLASRDDRLGAVRGAGLFLGMDVLDAGGAPDEGLASSIMNGLRERRVLIGITGTPHATLKFRPPLVFSSEHADHLVDQLEAVLSRDRTGSAPRP